MNKPKDYEELKEIIETLCKGKVGNDGLKL